MSYFSILRQFTLSEFNPPGIYPPAQDNWEKEAANTDFARVGGAQPARAPSKEDLHRVFFFSGKNICLLYDITGFKKTKQNKTPSVLPYSALEI